MKTGIKTYIWQCCGTPGSLQTQSPIPGLCTASASPALVSQPGRRRGPFPHLWGTSSTVPHSACVRPPAPEGPSWGWRLQHCLRLGRAGLPPPPPPLASAQPYDACRRVPPLLLPLAPPQSPVPPQCPARSLASPPGHQQCSGPPGSSPPPPPPPAVSECCPSSHRGGIDKSVVLRLS